MGSTFSGLEVGKRGITTHQQALHTTGHNISNADNKSYSRQRVTITTNDPIYDPSLNRAKVAGQIGQGSQVASIERVRDQYIDDRIIETSSQKEYWKTKDEYLHQVETVFNEPVGNTIRSNMDQFWSAWEELANYPQESAHRSVLKEKAVGLGSRIEDSFKKLDILRNQANSEVQNKTNQLTLIAEKLRVLNEKIGKAEALGDNPNDLYDRRDASIEELSTLVDVSIGRSDEDEFMVFVGQQILVQGSKRNNIVLVGNPENEGRWDLVWEETGKQVVLSSGRIVGLIEVRDKILKEKIDQLDSIAMNLMDTVNEIHKDGFGLNGKTNINFFEPRNLSRNSFGEFDTNGDGVNDMTTVFRVSGKTSVETDSPLGISGAMTFYRNDKNSTPVIVPYFNDDTLAGVINRINRSEAGVNAFMNHDNQLVIKGRIAEDHPKNNFIIRHIEDSGNLLVGLTGILSGNGTAGSYDFQRVGDVNKFQTERENVTFTPHYHPSSYVRVSQDILHNTANIAASRGKDVGGLGDYNTMNGYKDGSNALLIANALRDKPVMLEEQKTLADFYTFMISKLGTEEREARQEFGVQEAMILEFENLRQSIMGVSLDEEMANLVQFQHAFNASAKMIQTQSELLDTIINRLKV
ncbi:MAG: flagellar hook-associated protein FlgK [Leptospiraceae bacterium]|nr:flagellar hook-associated protein FlgK [Leptospiraceae bacterium]MCP5497059.1 flagellar hook-associated protein FlgK [Leptospiraceae bacterium]